MIGPNAEEIDDKTDLGTDAKTLESIVQQADDQYRVLTCARR